MDPSKQITTIDLTIAEPDVQILEAPLQPAPPLSAPETALKITREAAQDARPPSPDTIHIDDADDVDEGDDLQDEADLWENESIISDIVNSLTSEDEPDAPPVENANPSDGGDNSAEAVTKAELIRMLHRVGPHEFVAELLESEKYTPRGLCIALGVNVDFSVEELPEDHTIYYRVLGKIISRELTKRIKLDQYNTVEDAVELLKTKKNILVLTGAGISTSLGIPDFRSKNGLYNMLRDSPLAEHVDDPQDVFALSIFRESPEIFFTVAKSILSPATKFSPTHSFIRLLQDKDKLLTNYTQNIDNFEACAGIEPAKLVHCHGSFATATCQNCGHRVKGTVIEPEISAGRIPRCSVCMETLRRRRASVGPTGMKRKRSSNTVGKSAKNGKRYEWEDDSSEDDDIEDLSDEAAGIMKPDIVFFGEDLPQDFHERLSTKDKDLVDLVIVIGTSLMVAPVSEVPGFLPAEVPQIYINREPCRHINFDIELLGDSDVVVAEICRRAGWNLKHHMIPSEERAVTIAEDGFGYRHHFRKVVNEEAQPVCGVDTETNSEKGNIITLN